MSAPDLRSCSIASTVGITTRSTPRRSASAVTSSVTGSDPEAPQPITRRLRDHGISSAAVSGVCPYLPRSAFEGPFFRFRIRRSGRDGVMRDVAKLMRTIAMMVFERHPAGGRNSEFFQRCAERLGIAEPAKRGGAIEWAFPDCEAMATGVHPRLGLDTRVKNRGARIVEAHHAFDRRGGIGAERVSA